VVVTEKGGKLLRAKEKELEEYVNQHLGNLTPEEQTRFVELLEKFQNV
jgi:DNA-binding MarR family transcriptional regulator